MQKHIRGIRRKSIALLIAVVMLCSVLPASAFALGNTSGYLCGHVHDAACGYVEGGEGTHCSHVHDASCGYTEGSPCTDVHEHDAACGYCEGSACTYVHIHNESCGYNPETGEGCTDVHVHDASCGYIAAAPCTYSHTHDENCGYAEAAACNHVHDESCGYSESALAAPCSHICRILSFNNNTPGKAIGTYEAEVGEAYGDICAALPETLPGMLTCAEGDVNIPLSWSCADFTGVAGTYTFRAELTNAHCAYAVSDNPLTENVDESELPFITVTVPEAIEPTESATSLTSGAVTVSGVLPTGARLAVRALTDEELAAYVADDVNVVFAYDIKIMIPDGAGEIEYQPTAGNPVTVTITPPQPIEAPTVEVIHIAEDAQTGEPTPQPVATVTPTENTIEFEAGGFSIYIGTTPPTLVDVSELYYNGSGFFTNAECTEEKQVKDASGVAFTDMQSLINHVAGDLTIYMKAAYTISNTQSLNGGTVYRVMLKRNSDYTGALITIASGGNLTLSNITIDGGAVWSTAAPRTNSGITATEVAVSVTGSLTLNNGAVVQNNGRTNGNGGGVYVSGGTFTMNGGTVSDNSATDGGGVYVSSNGKFTMNRGMVSGNTAANNNGGGGVYVSGGTFTMNGGMVSGNTTNSFGGGVRVYAGNGTFTMNGGTVSNNTAKDGGGVSIFNGTFIMDGGAVSGNTATDNGGGVYISSSGKFTMNGGTVSSNTATNGGGVYVSGTGKFTMNGGTLSGNTATGTGGGVYVFDNGTVTVTGGSVNSIEGVTPTSGGTNTVTCHTITLVDGASPATAPVMAADTAVTELSLSTGTYGINDVKTDSNGKLYLWLPDGTTVSSVSAGGKTFTGTGTNFYSTDGYIFVNGSIGTSGDGTTPENAYKTFSSALTNASGKTIVVCGLTNITELQTISGNVTITSVYGNTDYRESGAMLKRGVSSLFNVTGSLTLQNVIVDGGVSVGGKLILSGSVDLRQTISLAQGKFITVAAGGFTPNSPLKLALDAAFTADSEVVRYTAPIADAAAELAKFSLLSPGCTLVQGEGDNAQKLLLASSAATVYLNGNDEAGDDHNNGSTPASAVKTLKKAYELLKANGGVIYICGQVTVNSTITLSGTSYSDGTDMVNIINSSVSIWRYSRPTAQESWQARYTGILINIASGGSLTLGDIELNGHRYATATAPAVAADNSLVRVDSGATLNINDGAVLQNNSTTSDGGGVYVDGGTFTMNGGMVSDNTTTNNNGGGVYVSGTFTMNGGTVSGNTATNNNGGGVYVYNGTFTMKGGTVSGNTAKNYGGGVRVYGAGGTFTMNGGAVSGNTVNSYGGGVCIYDGTFTMDGGAVSDNTVNSYGGGVYVSGKGTFTMDGGTVSGNTTTNSDGGGVYVSGTFTMNGGIVSDNVASGDGGGVRVYGAGVTFTMNGGAVSGNTATNNGGGVSIYNGTFTMKGGTVSGNTATNNGGGVYVSGTGSAAVTITGGTIFGNTATDTGGVYVSEYGSVTITGGSVNSIEGVTPTSDGTNRVTCHTITLVDGAPSATAPVMADTAVTELSLSTYGINDVKTDFDGKLYIWLPDGTTVSSVSAGGKTFTGTSATGADTSFYSTGGYIFVNGSIETSGDGTTAESAFKTFAEALTGANGKTIVVCGRTEITEQQNISGNVTITSVYDGTDYRASGAMLKRGVSSLFNVTGSLTLQNVIVDGGVSVGGKLILSGSVDLRQTISLAQDKFITVAAGGFTPTGPLKLALDADFTADSEVVRYTAPIADAAAELVKFSLLNPGCSLVQGAGDNAQKLLVSSSPSATVYLDGLAGDDHNNGSTPASAVQTLKKAYELLVVNGGVIYICGQVTVNSTITLSGTSYSDGTDMVNIINSSVSIWRYSRPTAQTGWQESYTGILINIASGGSLTLGDIELNGHRYATATAPAVAADNSLVRVDSGATLNINDGAVLRNNNNTYYLGKGGGVYVNYGGTFIMNGGTVNGNAASSAGGGVYVYNSGKFTMNGGEVSGNTVSVTGGGGVYVFGSGNFTMSGGTISGNTTNGNGGGVFANYSGTITMSGGTICSNTANAFGGGVYMSDSVFTMSGGTICNNTTNNGASVHVSGTATITGGSVNSIDGVTPTSDGTTAVTRHTITLVDGASPVTAPVMTDTAVTALSLSTAGTYGINDVKTDSNGKLYLWLPTGTTVSSVSAGGRTFTGTSATGADTSFYSTDGYIFVNGSLTTGDNNGTTPESAFKTFADALSNASGKTIVVCGLTEITAQQDVSANVTITSVHGSTDYRASGAMLKRGAGYTGSLFNVTGSLMLQEVTIDGGAVWTGEIDATLQRGTTNSGITASASAINVSTGGFLTLNSGAVLQNNNNSTGTGGGVNNSGTFTLNSGTLSGNSSSNADGGAVYNINGSFIMTGGSISGNTAGYGGGGVYTHSPDGTFTMSGGTISGNKGNGGVYVCAGSSFTMDGGAISHNTSSGVMVYYDAIFTMNDGTVSSNTGIGVQLYGDTNGGGTLNMTGGTVSDNTDSGVSMYTANDYPDNCRFNMSGGTICSNMAYGVHVNDGYFTLSGSPSLADEVYLKTDKIITVNAAFTPAVPVHVTGDGFVIGRKVATYEESVTPNTGYFSLSDERYSLKASGQNIVIGLLNREGTVTAAGEGVALGAGQSKTYTLPLGELFEAGTSASISNVTATAAEGGSFTYEAYNKVYQNRRNYGYIKANSTFGLSVTKTGGAETDSYATDYSSGISLGQVAADDTLTFKVYNANAITEYTPAGALTVTLSDGTNTVDVVININRRSDVQLNVTVPIQISASMDAAGIFTFPNGEDYAIENYSSVPVAITSMSWAWAESNANLFVDSTKLSASIRLGASDTSYSFTNTELTRTPLADGRIIAHNGILPGRLPLHWGLALGEGNALKSYPGDGVSVQIATVTYTINAAKEEISGG